MRLLWVIIISSLISGCAPYEKQPVLANKDSIHISSTLLIVAAPKNNLNAEIIHHSDLSSSDPSFLFGAAGLLTGGLVDAVIDSSKMKNSEAITSHLRTFLSDFDFSNAMAQALKPELSKVPALKLRNTQVVKKISKHQALKLMKASGDNATILIHAQNSMLANFRGIKITADFHIFLEKNGRDIFSSKVIYTSDLLPEKNIPKLIATWSAHHGQLLKQELHKAIQNTASRIRERLIQDKKIGY